MGGGHRKRERETRGDSAHFALDGGNEDDLRAGRATARSPYLLQVGSGPVSAPRPAGASEKPLTLGVETLGSKGAAELVDASAVASTAPTHGTEGTRKLAATRQFSSSIQASAPSGDRGRYMRTNSSATRIRLP